MYRIHQVLIPVDFSSFSRCAVTFGDNLGAKLQLVHAVQKMPSYMRSVLFPYAALGEDDREFEAEIAEATERRLRKYFEIDEALEERFIADPVLEFGAAKRAVPRWVGRFDVDLVAVGAFGDDGVFAAGPGSTSRRVVSASTQPVALIRDYDPEVEIEDLLVAVDLGPGSRQVLEVALGLAVELGARLQILHVIASPFVDDTNWLVERDVDVDVDRLQQKLGPRIEVLMEELVESVEIPVAVREKAQGAMQGWSVGFGDPAEEIEERVGEGDFDMVILGRGGGKEPGPGRVASAVMARLARHMVVVPEKRHKTPLG